jgi:predicted HAD superfamily Cof-like phosphohydrolase
MMPFRDALRYVEDFHRLIGETVSEKPRLLAGSRSKALELAQDLRKLIAIYRTSGDHVLNRTTLSLEETAEWLEAHAAEDLVEATDALADRLFVLLGDAVACGLPIGQAFDLVAKSNATKQQMRLADGKGQKGEGYVCPKKQLGELLDSISAQVIEKSGGNNLRVPTLGLDIDGVITDAPEFFSAWSHSWPGRVVVITFRLDREKAIRDLVERKIRYDQLHLVNRFEQKAEVIQNERVDLFVDDQPEILKHIGQEAWVLLFRNEGNYDFEERRWMFSDETGRRVS